MKFEDMLKSGLDEIVEEMRVANNTTALTIIRNLFANAQERGDGRCCDIPFHRFKVRDAGDWEAVNNLMHYVSVMFVDISGDVVKLMQTEMARALGHMKRAERVGIENAIDAIAKTSEYNALHEVLMAHDTLRERGAMRLRNADLYYDQIIGICEETFARRMKDGPKTRRTDRQHSSTGSGDRTPEQSAHGTEETSKEAGGPTAEELRQRRH